MLVCCCTIGCQHSTLNRLFWLCFPGMTSSLAKSTQIIGVHFQTFFLQFSHFLMFLNIQIYLIILKTYHHTPTVLRPFFRDHPGKPVPEENFWTLWCKGRVTEADTPTIRLGATPSRLISAHLHHPPIFLRARCPSCRPTNSVKVLKAN